MQSYAQMLTHSLKPAFHVILYARLPKEEEKEMEKEREEKKEEDEKKQEPIREEKN